MKSFYNIAYLITSIALLSLFSPTVSVASSKWDGSYNAVIDFKMSEKTVCPRKLPIEIELVVDRGKISGFIFNNGGGNTHQFCKLYHNGDISGRVLKDGTLDLVEINQKNAHSKLYSSFRLEGNIDGRIKLISRAPQYHPLHRFELVRRENNSASVVSSQKKDIIELSL